MRQAFTFTDSEKQVHTVSFRVIRNEGEFRTYGIAAEMTGENGEEETAAVTERFITREEAEATIEMLCACEVMPCTLKDVV